MSAQIEAALRAAGIETYPLDGTQTLALLWERLHPATESECDLIGSPPRAEVATATTIEEARNARHALLLAACDGAECGIDAGEDAGWLRHADGTLEEVLHLGSPPAHTDASWLSHLLCCPLPATLAVHIGVGGRAREQARQRRRWKRLRAAVLYKERRDRVVGSDEQEALEEAASVDAELAAEIGASVYRVGIYCSIRDPHGRARAVQANRQTNRARVSRANQRARDPRAAAVPSGLHLDAADRRRRAPRDPQLRAAEHRALRRADLEPLRVTRRGDRRDRRSRRNDRARRPVRPGPSPARHA